MIVFESVSFHYPPAGHAAISGVSFEIGPGVTLLVGPSGAGTSTVLLVAAGLAPSETGGHLSGRVRVLGLDPTVQDDRRQLAGRIGYVQPSPWTQLSGMTFTVADEVAFAAANLGWDRERVLEATRQGLESVDAGHLADRDPATLSGGELQRVMLAAALVTAPDVILLDNPTSELDVAGASRFFEALTSLSDSATVLLASHAIDRVVERANRVLLMDGGRVVLEGNTGVLASDDAFERNCLTIPALIAARSGVMHPYPLSKSELVRRVSAA